MDECIRKVAQEHGLSEKEVAGLVDDLQEAAKEGGSSVDIVGKVKDKIVEENAVTVVKERAQARIHELSMSRIKNSIDALLFATKRKSEDGSIIPSGKIYGADIINVFRGLMLGKTKNSVFAGRECTYADYEGTRARYMAPLMAELKRNPEFKSYIDVLVKNDPRISEQMSRELYRHFTGIEASQNPSVAKYSELLKTMYQSMKNESAMYGAKFNHLSDGVPVSLDFDKIRMADIKVFANDFAAAMDKKRSYGGTLIDSDESGEMVDSIAKNIYRSAANQVIERKPTKMERQLGEGGWKQKGDAMSQLERMFNIVPVDDKAYWTFMSKYGKDQSFHSSIMHAIEEFARQLALTKTFGPNPTLGFNRMVTAIKEGIERGDYHFANEVEKAKALHELNISTLTDERAPVLAKEVLDHLNTYKDNDPNFIFEFQKKNNGKPYGYTKLALERIANGAQNESVLREVAEALSGMGGHDDVVTNIKNYLNTDINLRNSESSLVRAFQETAGETHHVDPSNRRIAETYGSIRGFMNSTLYNLSQPAIFLGDFLASGFNLVWHDVTWAKALTMMIHSWRDSLKATPEETEQMTKLLGSAATEMLGSQLARLTHNEPGMMSKLQESTFALNGIRWLTMKGREAMMRSMMQFYGDLSPKNFFDLSIRQQKALLDQGIGPHKWEIIRQSIHEFNGRKYMVPEGLDHLDDKQLLELADIASTYDRKIPESHGQYQKVFDIISDDFYRKKDMYEKSPQFFRTELYNDIYRLMNDEVRFGVIDVDASTRYYLLRGTNPGTPYGEVLRFLSMAKTAPVGVIDRTLSRMFGGYDPRETAHMIDLPGGMRTNYLDLGKYLASAIVLGYVAQTAQDLLSGRGPRNPFTHPKVVFESLAKSGALGWYIDAVQAAIGGYNKNIVSNIAGAVGGPAYSKIDDAVEGLYKIFSGNRTASQKAYDFGKSNIPYANLWFWKAALDYSIFWNVGEMVSPGSYSRRQRWYKEKYGGEYWLSPM